MTKRDHKMNIRLNDDELKKLDLLCEHYSSNRSAVFRFMVNVFYGAFSSVIKKRVDKKSKLE